LNKYFINDSYLKIFLDILHLTTPAQSSNPELDLQPFILSLERFNLSKTVLYSAFFTITGCCFDTKELSLKTNNVLNVAEAPFFELDYDLSLENARNIFKKMYPNEEFLPRAPDPEEIVVDGEDPVALNESSLPEDLRSHFRELHLEKPTDTTNIQPMEE